MKYVVDNNLYWPLDLYFLMFDVKLISLQIYKYPSSVKCCGSWVVSRGHGPRGGGGGGVLPYKRLMRMYRWMESHFHNWIDYNGIAFSIVRVTRMRSHIFGFFGIGQFFIFTVSKRTRMFLLQMKSGVFFIQSKKWVNSLK